MTRTGFIYKLKFKIKSFYEIKGISTITKMSYEKKFVTLRKRLDQLGYRQTLGIETLPLVSCCRIYIIFNLKN